jgi:hypothetical protein
MQGPDARLSEMKQGAAWLEKLFHVLTRYYNGQHPN